MRRVLAVLLVAVGLAGTARSQGEADSRDPGAVEAVIWEREMAIFAGRSAGDISPYLNATSGAYLGWPPGFAEPLPLGDFKAGAGAAVALRGEVTAVERMGFTLNGNTALTYFRTHRTRLGEGMAAAGERDVDQYYENIHVWSWEAGAWRLIGGMARPVAAPAAP